MQPASLTSAPKPNVFTRCIHNIQARWKNRKIRYEPYDEECRIKSVVRSRSNSDLVCSPARENVSSDLSNRVHRSQSQSLDDRICSQTELRGR